MTGPPKVLACGTGKGYSPPARKRAGWPSRAIRFGSARILARLFARRALMKRLNSPALKMPKSCVLPFRATEAVEGPNFEATGWNTPGARAAPGVKAADCDA